MGYEYEDIMFTLVTSAHDRHFLKSLIGWEMKWQSHFILKIHGQIKFLKFCDIYFTTTCNLGVKLINSILFFLLWRRTQRNRLIPYTKLLALLVNWRPLLITTCKTLARAFSLFLSFSLFIYEAILIWHGSYGFLSFGLECCTYKCKLLGTTFNVITPGNY